MRATLSVFFLLAMAWAVAAQDPGPEPQGKPDEPKAGAADPKKKPAEPKQAPLFKLPEKELRKVEGLLKDYLLPGRKAKRDVEAKLQKLIEKPIDGHSALEDVAGIARAINRIRTFNPKIGRKGKINAVEVRPAVHGFPGGVGTVKYWIYLPNHYDPRKQQSPLLFCMPDNQRWLEARTYIRKAWLERSAQIRDEYVIVVPRPQSRGDAWSRPKSMARAMITLRHVMGPFDAVKKTAGPAVDATRIFIDGGNAAALVAGRFPEMFAGAILRDCRGRVDGVDLREAGGLSGLAAYSIYDGKRKAQVQFAQKLRAANDKSLLVEAAAEDGKFLGDATALYSWMESLPERTQPRKIEYLVHEPSFQRHHWINVLEYDASVKPAASFLAEADRARNVVRIEVEGITRFELFLNDAIVDLNKELRVVVVEGQKEFEFFHDTATRDLKVMLEELVGSNQPWRVYPLKFTVSLPILRERQAAIDAAEEAKKAAEKDAGKKGTGGDAPVDE